MKREADTLRGVGSSQILDKEKFCAIMKIKMEINGEELQFWCCYTLGDPPKFKDEKDEKIRNVFWNDNGTMEIKPWKKEFLCQKKNSMEKFLFDVFSAYESLTKKHETKIFH